MTALFDALEATWPAAALHRVGPWLIREGRGGGKRVSAATAEAAATEADIAGMEAMQMSLGQAPLVMIRDGEEALDAMLAAQGYRVIDPVVAYAAPVAAMTGALPYLAAFTIWPPLAIQREIWAAGRIGPGRLAVMDRVAGPKTSILARAADRPAGAGFVAIHGDTVMAHALEVAPDLRRQKAAAHMLRAAANWAQAAGATTFSLVVTEANAGARALYASLGMTVVGHYHYRMK
ncbi:MAG: GNAT family N-acetyltransferase [Rhodobacteraceae bacterium]|nr:GNAT family N-acetyltransferase [Paracoccaceae bacterium]